MSIFNLRIAELSYHTKCQICRKRPRAHGRIWNANRIFLCDECVKPPSKFADAPETTLLFEYLEACTLYELDGLMIDNHVSENSVIAFKVHGHFDKYLFCRAWAHDHEKCSVLDIKGREMKNMHWDTRIEICDHDKFYTRTFHVRIK